MKVKLIVFEGIDGSGKSTQANLLFERLGPGRVSLHKELYTHHIGSSVRNLLERENVGPFTEVLLIAAARWNMYEKLLSYLLLDDTVICDRFISSGWVYGKFGRGLQDKFLENLFPPIVPDLTILLDIDLENRLDLFLQFRKLSGLSIDIVGDRYNQGSIRQGFLMEWEKRVNEGQNWLLLDGFENRTILSEKIWEAVQKLSSEPIKQS